MSAITFIVPFAPVAWQRTGVRWTNQGPKHYTPAQTRAWEQTVATHARSAMRSNRADQLSVAVELQVRFFLPVPASWPKWKRALALEGRVVPTSTPDLDNLEKAVKDAMKGIVWVDDSYVVDGAKSKRYCAQPRVEVSIVPLPDLLPAQVSRRPNRGECHAS